MQMLMESDGEFHILIHQKILSLANISCPIILHPLFVINIHQSSELQSPSDKEKANLIIANKDSHYLPYTNSMYSAVLVPSSLVASQRYVPLSVLFSVVMVNSLPSTIIRSMSGSSPPSLDHTTRFGLGNKGQTVLCI